MRLLHVQSGDGIQATQKRVDERIVKGCTVFIKNATEQRFLGKVTATVEAVNRKTGYVTIYTKKVLYIPTYEIPFEAVEFVG